MVVLVRKKNVILLSVVLFMLLCFYSFNTPLFEVKPVTGGQNLYKTILLDPGHGGEDPGAVSDYSGVKEKDLSLKISIMLKELLEKENFKVLMTRSEDRLEYTTEKKDIVLKRSEDLYRRKKMMDEGGADIVVSIHLNKFGQTQYFGAQAFFPPGSKESQRLAASIQSSIRELVDPNNTREALVKNEPLIILKNNKTVTTIVECGFLSNQDEEKKLVKDEYQQKLVEGIKEGIIRYFKSP